MRSAAILFDLDGTLADTAPDLVHAVNRVLNDDDLPAMPLSRLRPMITHGGLGMLSRAYDTHRDDPILQTKMQRFLNYYQNRIAVDTRLFPGMAEVLSSIEDAGKPWGIVTNKRTGLTEPLVDELRLLARAGCVVCGDTTAHLKPHPAPLLHASKMIGVAPSACVFVGDAAKDIEAGRRAGMRTIAVSFGYRESDDDPADWGADHVAHDSEELMLYL